MLALFDITIKKCTLKFTQRCPRKFTQKGDFSWTKVTIRIHQKVSTRSHCTRNVSIPCILQCISVNDLILFGYSQNNHIIAMTDDWKIVRRFCNSKVDVSIALKEQWYRLLPDNILWKGTFVLNRVKCCGFLIPFECPHQEFREHGEFKEKWGHVPRTFGQIIPSMIRTKALLSIVIIGSLAPSLPLLWYYTVVVTLTMFQAKVWISSFINRSNEFKL